MIHALTRVPRRLREGIAALEPRMAALWAALIWYVAVMARLPPAPVATWARAAGLAVIVGGLLLANAIPAGGSWRNLPRAAVGRFFLIPFCVASFSAQTHGRGFRLIVPARLDDALLAVGATLAWLLLYLHLRRTRGSSAGRFP